MDQSKLIGQSFLKEIKKTSSSKPYKELEHPQTYN